MLLKVHKVCAYSYHSLDSPLFHSCHVCAAQVTDLMQDANDGGAESPPPAAAAKRKGKAPKQPREPPAERRGGGRRGAGRGGSRRTGAPTLLADWDAKRASAGAVALTLLTARMSAGQVQDQFATFARG